MVMGGRSSLSSSSLPSSVHSLLINIINVFPACITDMQAHTYSARNARQCARRLTAHHHLHYIMYGVRHIIIFHMFPLLMPPQPVADTETIVVNTLEHMWNCECMRTSSLTTFNTFHVRFHDGNATKTPIRPTLPTTSALCNYTDSLAFWVDAWIPTTVFRVCYAPVSYTWQDSHHLSKISHFPCFAHSKTEFE